jgi:hypothetical protein
MDEKTEEQANSAFESRLWEEISDEAAAACVGGNLRSLFSRSELREYIRQFQKNTRIYRRYLRQT